MKNFNIVNLLIISSNSLMQPSGCKKKLKNYQEKIWRFEKKSYLCTPFEKRAAERLGVLQKTGAEKQIQKNL